MIFYHLHSTVGMCIVTRAEVEYIWTKTVEYLNITKFIIRACGKIFIYQKCLKCFFCLTFDIITHVRVRYTWKSDLRITQKWVTCNKLNYYVCTLILKNFMTICQS